MSKSTVRKIRCNLRPFVPREATYSLYQALDAKKQALKALRPMSPEQAADLKRLYDLDLTGSPCKPVQFNKFNGLKRSITLLHA